MGHTPLFMCSATEAGFYGCKIAQMLIAHGANTTSSVPIKEKREKTNTPIENIDMLATGVTYNMEQRLRNKGIRRLLLQAEAVRAVSWAWPGAAKKVAIRARDSSETSVPPRRMLHIMRRRAGRPKVLLAALTRYVGGCGCCVIVFLKVFLSPTFLFFTELRAPRICLQVQQEARWRLHQEGR